MSWKTIKLGDIAEFSNGVNFDKSAYSKGVKLVGVSNFGNRFSPDYDSLDEIKEEVVRSTDFLLDGDIVFVRSNGNKELVGRCMLIDNVTTPVTYSGFCIRARLKDNSKYDPLFFTFLFKSVAFRKALTGTAIGANIQNLSQGRLSSCTVQVPDFKTQQHIADILYSYQSLIENNQKQIKLLEEAAQRLYKEWFVDLRFPGYENTPITDGVPQGWKQESIDNVYSIKYGKNLPTTEISTNGKYPVYGANGVIGYYDKYNCDAYVTLITSRGNGSGDVSRTHHSNSFVTNNSFVVIPQQAYDFISNEFTYWLMKHTDFKSICTGSAQPQLTNNSISTLKFLVPTKKLILYFCEITRTYFENIERLLKQNRLLTEARDRLLPKLMSGELEV